MPCEFGRYPDLCCIYSEGIRDAMMNYRDHEVCTEIDPYAQKGNPHECSFSICLLLIFREGFNSGYRYCKDSNFAGSRT